MMDVMIVRMCVNFSTLFSARTHALRRKYVSGFQLGRLNQYVGITEELLEKIGLGRKCQSQILRYFQTKFGRTGDKCQSH